MIRRTLVLLPVILALALWALWPDRGESFATGQKAPEISGGPWINTQPLSLSDLKGRVILVEFWTYG